MKWIGEVQATLEAEPGRECKDARRDASLDRTAPGVNNSGWMSGLGHLDKRIWWLRVPAAADATDVLVLSQLKASSRCYMPASTAGLGAAGTVYSAVPVPELVAATCISRLGSSVS
jgi:hypothetical protein